MWVNVLFSDDRSEWSPDTLTDPRVVHLWDADRAVGTWFPKQAGYKDLTSGPLAWDIYFLYDDDATWDELPAPLLSSGHTVFGSRGKLEKALVALLSRG